MMPYVKSRATKAGSHQPVQGFDSVKSRSPGTHGLIRH